MSAPLPSRLRLGTRVLVQWALFGAVLCALVVGAAGTVSAWPLVAFLATFLGCALLLSGYLLVRDPALLVRRLEVGAHGEPSRSQQVIQSLSGLSFLALLVTAGLDHRFGVSSVPAWAVVSANGLLAVGFLLIFFVFRENTFTSSVVAVEQDQQVVTSGPYRIVRHPMYSAGLLILVAAPIAMGSWLAEVFFVALAVLIILRLQDEERLLVRELKGYDGYRRQTRHRLVPGIW